MLHIKKKRNNSTTSIATNKGLTNEPGENNCFLNSAIQVLWHLDVFRRSFRQLAGHACMGTSCIFCALKSIFEQFQYSQDQALAPDILRCALAKTFKQQNRFQLGLMDDAAECFEKILNLIHVHIGTTIKEDVCTAPHCIPHQKFGLALIRHSVCVCGATSEPMPYIEMVHYVSATALCIENEAMSQKYGGSSSQMFGKLIRIAASWGDLRSCPSECGAQIEMREVLMNCPDVVSVGIVWDSEEPETQHIINLVHALGTTLRLVDLFHTVVDERAKQMELYLVGMVCYYGKHYSTFFFHTKMKKWIYFDDAQVSVVGKRWGDVISKCIKGRHQPLLLLYANPFAKPVSVSTAPKDVTLLPGYSDFHGYSENVMKSPLQEASEPESTNSDNESTSVAEESSGTESMQASVATHSPQFPVKHSRNKTSASSFNPSPTKQHHKPDKSKSKFYVEKGEEVADKPKTRKSKTTSAQTVNMPSSEQIKSTQPKPVQKQETQKPRKPVFQWHMANDQSQHSSQKVGHYVEPQPANWTKYKPYSSQPQQQPTPKTQQKVVVGQRTVKQSTDRGLAVKAVDSKGMTAFCVTAKADRGSHESIPHHRSREKRSPTPTQAPRKHGGIEMPLVAIGRHSSSSSSRRTSQSSQGSSSSGGASSYDGNTQERRRREASAPKRTPSSGSSSTVKGLQVCVAAPTSTTFPQNNRCLSLFRDAEDLMEQSRAADSIMDYASALQLCLEATKVIEMILQMENLPEDHLVKARIKHGDCINRSRILQRRRNIRLQSHGSESGGTRLSMAEADRHMNSSANQMLKPSKPHSSTPNRTLVMDSHVTTTANPITSFLHGRISPRKDEKLMKDLEKDDANENLINFNKPGVTKLQSEVHQMYEQQNRMKERSDYPRSVKVGQARSNFNNNNSGNSPVVSQGPASSEEEKKTERTNIFVWGKPDKPIANPGLNPPRLTQQVSTPNISGPSRNEKLRNLASDTDLRRPSSLQNKEEESSHKERSTAEDLSDRMKSLDVESSRKVRSVTPTPQTKNETTMLLSQQRRSKTPTPATNKEFLRSKQTIGMRRGSDLKIRPRSTYDVPIATLAPENISSKPPNDADVNKKLVADSEIPSNKPEAMQFPYPFPFPAWGSPPIMGPGFAPSMVPPEYYQNFYKWLQYYAALSPEQRNMLAFNLPGSFPFPSMYPMTSSNMTAPPSMQAAYLENLKSHLGKNLANFTSTVGRVTPHLKTNNMNIYEASKPKPVNRNNHTSTSMEPAQSARTSIPHPHSTASNLGFSSSNLSSDPRSSYPAGNPRSSYPDSNPRSSNMPQRRPPVGSRPAAVYPKRENPLANSVPSNTSRDRPRPINSETQQEPSFLEQPKQKEGMMKWAEEGKKRAPYKNVDPAHRNKLLQEFANRPRKDQLDAKSAVLQKNPDTKTNPQAPTQNPPSRFAPSYSQQCQLCGLVRVSGPEDYCASCRAYLTRLKPTVNSLRTTKHT